MLRFTFIAPQASYAVSTALCVTNRAGVQPRPQSKPAAMDFVMQNMQIDNQ